MILEREGLEQEKVWLIHKNGFTLGSVVSDSPKRTAQYNHYSMVRSQVSHVHVLYEPVGDVDMISTTFKYIQHIHGFFAICAHFSLCLHMWCKTIH